MALIFTLIILLLAEILEADEDDPLLIVDNEKPSEENTRLPNSQSAALAMGFVFLCVFLYAAYRFCKGKCGRQKQPLTVSLSGQNDGDTSLEGVEKYNKERQAYLEIFGRQNMNHTNSIQLKPSSSATTKPERKSSIVISVIKTSDNN